MKSYSLSTLLLLMVVVALILSQVILMQQLRVAREDVNDVRRKFGYIHVVDKSKTYVALIAENEADGTAFRVWVPKGSHYVLHLTDATFDSNEGPADPVPTTSISLNDWQQGADTTLSCSLYWENNSPRAIVHDKTSQLMDHVLPDWIGASGPSELTWYPGAQTEYTSNQNIPLMLWRNTSSKRGILLWLEPLAKSDARRAAAAAKPKPDREEGVK
jgi:hypothetical protein